MKTHSKETQATTTPAMALQFLKEGNFRFVNSLRADRSLLRQVNETREGQWPFAAVLSCIDSRTSAELIFDQGLGDIFSIRIAGTVLNDDILGSMEFACSLAGSKLVVVLGHTNCGAIRGAVNNVQLGNLSSLLKKIQPSIHLEKVETGDRTSANTTFIEDVTKIQVKRSVQGIVEQSAILKSLILDRSVGLIGAMYSVETGAVEFFEETYMCGEIKRFFTSHESGKL